VNSGIPNHAFYLAATGIGGKSWERAGKVWYAALTDKKATPTMKFKPFSMLTKAAAKRLYPREPAVYAAVAKGWKSVGL
jgi:Zn-dependent metalloprotease